MKARDRWAVAGYEEVTLPSGFRVRGVRPTSRDLLLHDLLPGDLTALVMSAEAKGRANAPLDPEERSATIAAQRIEAAAFVRQVWDEETGAWEDVTLKASDLNDGGFDPRDVDALEDIVLFRRTPAQITASTQAALEQITTADAAVVEREEAGGTVDGQAAFRDDGGRDDAGANGRTVRPAPVRPRRATARGTGAGSGAGAAAGAG